MPSLGCVIVPLTLKYPQLHLSLGSFVRITFMTGAFSRLRHSGRKRLRRWRSVSCVCKANQQNMLTRGKKHYFNVKRYLYRLKEPYLEVHLRKLGTPVPPETAVPQRRRHSHTAPRDHGNGENDRYDIKKGGLRSAERNIKLKLTTGARTARAAQEIEADVGVEQAYEEVDGEHDVAEAWNGEGVATISEDKLQG